jgi:hypothetical protein
MVKRLQTQSEGLYGLPTPITNQFPTPIVARRNPAATDTGYMIGQVWVNKLNGTVYALASNTAGVATWLSLGGSFSPTVANVTVTGTITSLNFVTSTAATSTKLTQNVWSAIGTNGNIPLVLTPKGISAVEITTGGLLVDAGNITATAGDVDLTLGDVNLTAGDVNLTLGNVNLTDGIINLLTAGNGIEIKEGVNATLGTSTLVAGTKSIAIAGVDASSRIFLSRCDLNASPVLGFLIADTSVPGTLTITSYDATGVLAATDVSKFNYLLIEAL